MARRENTGRYTKTRWSGVYVRNGVYYPRLYLGKEDGRSKFEWLEGHSTGSAAADALAAARVQRSERQRGSAHTVASWAGRSAEHPFGLWLALRPRPKEATMRNYAADLAPFVRAYGDVALAGIDVETALEWVEVRGMRWSLGGIRAMFTDARRAGLVPSNPFAGLGQKSGPGRKYFDVLTVAQVDELAAAALAVGGSQWEAFVLWQAYVGTRPAEAYGLLRADIDFAAGEVDIERQRTPYDSATEIEDLPLPKNGLTRRVTVLPPALNAVRALPTPLDPLAPLWKSNKSRPMSGANQHYYWHPIRCAFGQPKLDLYMLRHFCGSFLLNTLELPPQDVALQLGHTDGGVLVQKLYGHPSAELARKRIADAYKASATPTSISRRTGVAKESQYR